MIEFTEVSKTYANGTCALKKINLKVDNGEFAFILGPSGSGKSTLLKLIMCEEQPSSGELNVNGFDLKKISHKQIPFLRRTMGVVFQDFRLIPSMTVFDNVAFALRVTGSNERDIRKKVPTVLSLVELTGKARRFPHELSGGEQQRVALARALINDPSLIIADEPTGNVDPQLSYQIVEMLSEINQRGTTVLMVTHEHQLVSKFDKRILIIDQGSIVADSADRRPQ